MKFEEIQEILNRQLLKLENRCLNDTEQLLLRGLWQKKNYQEIAQENGYSSSYLANVVAPGLYDRVSQLIGETVNKKNFFFISTTISFYQLHIASVLRSGISPK